MAFDARRHEIETLFERPDAGESAVLVHVDFDGQGAPEDADIDEFADLVRAAGARIVGSLRARRSQPSPRYFLGSGKTEELAATLREADARLAIFDHDLTPAQERNLEKALEARVLSRTGLILDIFAQRARTHEGKLQVELAQLEHMSARLVRGWSHLDREKGGIGLRGAGEKQLELDQRLIQGRITAITRRLERVRRRRAQSRRSRQRADLPLIALVGYTNTGKSTLFNALSRAHVLEADQLFATLDPTIRRLDIPGFGPAVIADTVGFIRRLPHKLVDSFKATLEEVVEADLLLHVLDASDPEMADKREQVHTVLAEMDAMSVPRLEVLNKIDQAQDQEPALLRDDAGRPLAVRVSARDRLGFDLIEEAVAARLGNAVRVTAVLGPRQGRLRAHMHEQGWVEGEQIDGEGNQHLALHLPAETARRMQAQGVCIDAPPRDPDSEPDAAKARPLPTNHASASQ